MSSATHMPSGRWVGMRIVVLSLLLLAAAAPAAAAAGQLRLRPLADGHGLSSDGARWAAWALPGEGGTRVFDAATGSTRTVPPPQDCEDAAAVGGGQLMFRCVDAEGHTEVGLYALADGTLRRVALPAEVKPWEDASNRAALSRVGRAWIAGAFPASGDEQFPPRSFYLHWRTGRYRTQRESSRFQRLDHRRDRYADLDAGGLVRPVCRAARERRGDGTALLQVVGRRVLKSVTFGLRVDTCGGRRIKITRCGGEDYDCGTEQLGSRWVVWTEAGRARAYDLRRSRFYRTRRLGRTDDVRAAHVRGALFVQAGGRLYRAKLPR